MTAAGDPYDGSPVAALRRIAFLLERGRADTFKVQAYRKAAAAILPLPHDEVARRAADGTLTDLPGIGNSTARVIGDAVGRPHAGAARRGRGAVRRAAGRRRRAGSASALRGDLHSHSDWSDGGSPIEEMAMTAIELGHDYLVLTDHSPRLRVARGLSVERLARQLDVVDAVNTHLGGAAGGVPAAQGHRGRHPRRRRPRPDRGDAGPARGPGRQRPLQAGHGPPSR